MPTQEKKKKICTGALKLPFILFETPRHFRRWGGQSAHTRKKKMCTGAKKLRFILFDILFNLFNLYLIFYF